MEFPFRDGHKASPICLSAYRPLASERGQGTIEYVLVLVVAVAIIMGGLYQLNTAFKSWANNYFGDYLACLLETGELPTIGGTPGDSGICDELFKPFSLAEGRPLAGPRPNQAAEGGGQQTGGQREARRGGGGGGGGRINYGGGGRFTGGNSRGPGGQNRPVRKAAQINTGNTSASGYGGGYNYTQRPSRQPVKAKLDNQFAFEDGRERQRRRALASAKSKKEDEGNERGRYKMKPKAFKSKASEAADATFTIGNFIKFLIIAAIIIALVMFLGGQALSISKSMD